MVRLALKNIEKIKPALEKSNHKENLVSLKCRTEMVS